MRPENKRMQQWLKSHGIDAKPKWISTGSLKRTWRLFNPAIRWTDELAQQLNGLGFLDFDNRPLGRFSGNGGFFSVCVRGHEELL